MDDIDVKKAAKIGFGFGIGFFAAGILVSIIGFLLYIPVMLGL